MAYRIEFEAEAAEEFDRLDGSIKGQMKKFLKKLSERENPKTFGEPLEENLVGFWKYRVGEYRIIAEIQDDVLLVLLLVIGKRDKVYKTASKRLSEARGRP